MASNEHRIELGNYRVLKNGDGQDWELGRGAFGTTYKAEHKHLPRFCALKVINDNLIRRSNTKQRFLQEAQAASLLEHPNIAQIYDFGESEGIFYYAMTYCAGFDLEHYAKAKGPQPWSSVKKMAKQIFSALVEAHSKGLLHRDIKPSNIMLMENDGTVNLKLIDFGLVKVLEQSSSHKTNVLLTNDGGFLGSPLTASPEQLEEEELDERSDLFSVGVTLWYLLVGGSPFESTSTAQLVHQRLNADAYDSDFPADLEPEAVGILSKLLKKSKAERYTSAQQVLADLEDPSYEPTATDSMETSSEPSPLTPIATDQAEEAEALQEKMNEVDADWSEIWEILSIVHQDINGTLYNCISKKDATVKSSIYIPDPEELCFQEVVTNCDKFMTCEVKNLSPFVSKGLYDGEVCYLSTTYPVADVSLLIRQVSELGLSKYNHLFGGIASAIDEGSTLGMPGLHLSHDEIKLAFSGQPMDLTADQWVNHFNQGASNIVDLINTLEVFVFPKFVDNKSVDDISMTLSNEDLATSTLSSFAGFIYSAVSGMKVKQSVYLTSSAHISTSNLSEESNDYLSKVIAAELMPDSAVAFLERLSELENISSDSSASIYTTQDMKRLRRDGLLEAHQTMASQSQIPGKRAAESPAQIAASLSAKATTPKISTPSKTDKPIVGKQTFVAQPLDSPVDKAPAVAPKKAEKKKPAPKKKPEKAPVEKKKQGGKSLKILVPVIVLLLGIGGYFAYPFLFPKEKKRSRSSDSNELTDTSKSGDTSDPVIPKNPPVSEGTKVYINIKNMKGLDLSTDGSLLVSTFEGEELGELEPDGEQRFNIVLKNQVIESWTDQAIFLRLKSTDFSIGQIKLLRSDFVESDKKDYLESSIEINVWKKITFTPKVTFAGKNYAECAELLKVYLYREDHDLEFKKEVNGDQISLLVPIDTVFPIKTQITLPGCNKIVKSITSEGGEIHWDIKLKKKILSVYRLPEYDELKYSPDLSSISEAKIRAFLSEAASSEAINPRKDEDGISEFSVSILKGELEIITQNGNSKQTVDIASDAVAKVLSSIADTYPKNIKMLISSAESGVLDSQYNLGVQFYAGDGVDQDLVSAAGWFALAARKGDDSARNNLAMMYLYGEGVPVNRVKALKLYKVGSDAGNAEASRSLGMCYLKGLGEEKNIPKAIEYYKKAIKLGDTLADFELGGIYGDPEFEVVDIDKAIECFTRASEKGHAASSFNLGLIYSGAVDQGKRDIDKAISYYQTAHKQGYKEAKKALEQLNAPLE